MSRPLPLVPPDAVAKARAFAERRLSAEEFARAASAPIGDAERDEVRSLVAWFRQRYPTPAERLAYVRRAYARWVPGTPR